MKKIEQIINAPNDPNAPPNNLHGHTLCYCQSKMYLYGGWDDEAKKYNNNLYVFCFETLKWDIKPLPEENSRSYHTANIFNNKMYIVGGLYYETILPGVDVLDLQTYKIDHIQSKSDLLPPKYFHSTVLYKGSLYIYGGRTFIEVFSPQFVKFDIESQKFHSLDDKEGFREKHGCFITNGGFMYVIGGYAKRGEASTIKKFDTETKNWLDCQGFDYIAMSICGNKGEEPVDDVYLFDERHLKGTVLERISSMDVKSGHSFIVVHGGEGNKKPMRICCLNKTMKWEDLRRVVDEEKRVVVQHKIEVDAELYEFLTKYQIVHLLVKLLEIKLDTLSALFTTTQDDLIKAGIPRGYAQQLLIAVSSERSSYEYLTECEKGDYIGKGNFGQVFKGMWLGTTPVAMKEINGALEDPKKLRELEKEAYVTQLMNHPNLITMYGLYKTDDQLFMVMDLADGSLNTFFNERAYTKLQMKITLKKMVMMALDCASGMAYLESKKIVHRDLALRNLLYVRSVDGIKVKVADLGLSRTTNTGEYKSKIEIFPRKWTAPEAADDSSPTYLIFNTKTDVWSFGVTFWEILTEGRNPYSEYTPKDAVKAVIKGERLEMPTRLEKNGVVGSKIWDVVSMCWDVSPEKRPSFAEIYKKLDTILEDITEDDILSEDGYEEADNYEG
ncbi:Tyrosine protein kinase [Entamoeba marina]